MRDSSRSALAKGCAVVLSGPAGIGKSTLAREILSRLEFTTGQCLSSMEDRRHRPLEHALRCSLVGAADSVGVEVASRQGDRVLFVEDLHWADGATLEVLAYLAGVVPILTTTRGPDPFDESARRFPVPLLSRRSARSLVRQVHPGLDDDQTEQLVALANGNPLLIHQLSLGAELAFSPTLADAVRSRVAVLPSADRRSLALLALHGRPAPSALVRAEAGLVGLTQFDRDGAIWFTHDLLHDAVLRSIDPSEALELHRDLATRCGAAEAAAHLLAAGDPEAACAAAELAAIDAAVPERARLLLMAAHTRAPNASQSLRLDAAEALLAAHRPGDALDLLEDLRPDAPVVAATVGWFRARAEWLLGDAVTARRLVTDALTLVAGTQSPIEAHLRVEGANIDIRERPADPALQDEIAMALEVAQNAGVDRARAHSLAGRALAHAFRSGWREQYRAAAEVARAEGDHDQECAAAYWEVSALGFYGPLCDALIVGRTLVARAHELGQVGWYHHALGALGLQSAIAGAMNEKLPNQLELLLHHDPRFRNRSQVRMALVLARIDNSDFDGAAEQASALRSEARSNEDISLACVAESELADAFGDEANMDAALTQLASCNAGFFGLKVIAEGCAIHLHLRSTGDLPDLPRYSELCPPVLSGIATERDAYDEARAGRPDEGAAVMERAALEYETIGAPRFAARSWHGAASCWARAGRGEAAATALDRAAELSSCHGFGSLDEAVGRSRRTLLIRTAQARLTTRELQVLTAVARGATSVEIALEFGTRSSTVDSQIESARRKLGARTRRQAAAIVVDG